MKCLNNISYRGKGSINRTFNHCKQINENLDDIIKCVCNKNDNVVDNLNVPTLNAPEDNIDAHLFHTQLKAINIEATPLTEPTSLTGAMPFIDNLNANPFATIRPPFNPQQVKRAYNVPTIRPSANKRKVIITIVTAFYNPNIKSNVDAFSARFGLPKCDLSVYNFAGNNFNLDCAIETTLDVEWAFAINPNAKIRLILAKSNKFTDLFDAIKFANNRFNFSPPIDTDLLSMSWGADDNIGFKNITHHFTNPNVCYFAASGDSNNTSYPSVVSNVISVGGTRLALNSNGTRNAEIPWTKAGSGYALSSAKPNYQPILAFNINNARRMIPDVSGVADPETGVIVIASGSTFSVGGTSLSCPIIVGIVSLAIQQRINNNKSSLTSVTNVLSNSIKLQPLLYNISNKKIFHDIVKGKDGIYSATPGFDLASGLGVINGQNLINIIGNV
jgi:subtilase family serine protease